METILFYILAVVAVSSAVLAITRINPLATALWLAMCFIAVGGLFGLLDAPVVALFQILLAAGAIMVLFVFVIMLVDLDPKGFKGRAVRFAKIIGAFASAYLLAMIAISVLKPPFESAPSANHSYSSASTLGRLLVDEFVIPFELASVLLLIAMVGAVVMGRRKT